MKNKIYYGIITLILCISIISMSTISLYAASYNKRAQVIGSYLSVYAYSYCGTTSRKRTHKIDKF